jgi:hypothetical protein
MQSVRAGMPVSVVRPRMPRGSLPSWGAPIARHEGPPEPRQRRSQWVFGGLLQHRHHRPQTPAVLVSGDRTK